MPVRSAPLLATLSFLLLAALPAAGQEYGFVDVTDAAGVANADHAHFGCTWSDYDGDGDLDLYVANDDDNTLYRNEGDGTFTDVTEETGTGDPWVAMRNVWADYDKDGDLDLYSHNFVQSTLYRNDDLDFVDVNEESGAGLEMPNGTGAAWADYDRDGWIDLHATGFPEGWNALLRNQGDGTFVDMQAEAGLPFDADGMGNAWGDYDADGWPDLAVAAVIPEGDENFLYRNRGDGTFEAVTQSAGIVLEEGSSTAAVLFADYDDDGWFDLLFTEVQLGSAKTLPNRIYLFRNQGDGTFVDVTADAGIELPAPPPGGTRLEYWDASFADWDNDGDEDLYLGVRNETNRFYRNQGDGTFVEIGAELGVDFAGYLKGMAWGDYDEDGDLDLYVLQRNEDASGMEPNFLLENQGGSNHWLQVELGAITANTDAIGSRIEVFAGSRSWVREVRGGSGFFDQHTPIEQFGLGSRSSVDRVRVTWPGGAVSTYREPAVDSKLSVLQLWSDPFEDGELPSEWAFAVGSWTEADGGLRGAPQPGERTAAALASPAFTGCGVCDLDARLQVGGVDGAAGPPLVRIFGWFESFGRHVALILDPDGDRLVLLQRSGGGIADLASAAATIEPGQTHRVKVSFDGADFVVHFDGQALLERPSVLVDPAGTFGVMARDATVRLLEVTASESS